MPRTPPRSKDATGMPGLKKVPTAGQYKSSADETMTSTSSTAAPSAVASTSSLPSLTKVPTASKQPPIKFLPSALSTDWDPDSPKNVNVGTPPEACFLRVKRDIIIFHNDPPPGVFMEPDPMDMTVIHTLITGPIDTPYEGGFFYFIFRFPNNYPIYPPMVKLMTTGDSRVRFNPNLYRNGKVCLSLLRTWSGPDWSPCLTLSNLLLSIQSLMSERPYHNEPGFEMEHKKGDAERYNEIIQHETLRVAVCDMLDGVGRAGNRCPNSLKDIMEKTFPEFYDYYKAVAQSKVHLDDTPMLDPFGDKRGNFAYSTILGRLEAIKKKLDEKRKIAQEISSEDDTDSV